MIFGDIRDQCRIDRLNPEASPEQTASRSFEYRGVNVRLPQDQARAAEEGAVDLRLYGLYGCDTLCAIACLQPVAVRTGTDHAVKLDSVVVHGHMRQRGLGAMIVAHAFADIASDPELDVSRLYSHAVHPATVKLLTRLGFGAPPPTGAPLAAIDLSEKGVLWPLAYAARSS